MSTKQTSKSSSADELLTVKDIALRDQCSERTVRRAIKADKLQALRVGPGGRLLRVTQQAHETYRKAQRL